MSEDNENNDKGKFLERWSRRLSKNASDIQKWLDNFKIEEQPYAERVLEHFRFIDKEELKAICMKLNVAILKSFNLSDIVFVSIGGEAKSDKVIAYFFRMYNNHPEELFVNRWNPVLSELRNKVIIYLDDVSSSGKQLCDDWKIFQNSISQDFIETNTFIFAPLFITEKAKDKIEKDTKFQIIFLEKNLLTNKNNILSEESDVFTENERPIAKRIFQKYGKKLYPKGPLGYGDSGLLLAFDYNTPNNTLPIVWAHSHDINFSWTPLFPRYESKKTKFIYIKKKLNKISSAENGHKSRDTWNNKGVILARDGQFEEAAKCFEKALKLDPTNKKAIYNLGLAFAKQGQLEKAKKYFENAIDLDPEFKEAWNNKGVTLFEQDQFEEAIKCTKKALEIDPTFEDAWNNLGLIFAEQGQLEKAKKYFENALEINPTFEDAWNNLGVVFAEQNQTEDAIKCLEKAIELDPTLVTAWYNLGDEYLKINRYNLSINSYKRAIQLDPESDYAYDKLELAVSEKVKYKGDKKTDNIVENFSTSIINLSPEIASKLFSEFRSAKIYLLLCRIFEDLKIPQKQISNLINLIHQLKYYIEEQKLIHSSLLVIKNDFNIELLNLCYIIDTQLKLSDNISDIKRVAQIVNGYDGGLVVRASGKIEGICIFESIKSDKDNLMPKRYHKISAISHRTQGLLFLFRGDGRISVFYKGNRILNHTDLVWSIFPQNLKTQILNLFEKHQIDKEMLLEILRIIIYISDKRMGALITIGDHKEVLKMRDPQKINYIKWKSLKLNQNDISAISGIIAQDGATIISKEGKVIRAMTFLRPPVSNRGEIEVGKGSRHNTAANVSASTNAITIAISVDGPITVYSRGKIVLRIIQ